MWSRQIAPCQYSSQSVCLLNKLIHLKPANVHMFVFIALRWDRLIQVTVCAISLPDWSPIAGTQSHIPQCQSEWLRVPEIPRTQTSVCKGFPPSPSVEHLTTHQPANSLWNVCWHFAAHRELWRSGGTTIHNQCILTSRGYNPAVPIPQSQSPHQGGCRVPRRPTLKVVFYFGTPC